MCIYRPLPNTTHQPYVCGWPDATTENTVTREIASATTTSRKILPCEPHTNFTTANERKRYPDSFELYPELNFSLKLLNTTLRLSRGKGKGNAKWKNINVKSCGIHLVSKIIWTIVLFALWQPRQLQTRKTHVIFSFQWMVRSTWGVI